MVKQANPERSYQGNPESMKWPTDKDKYDKNYLRLYGKKCPICDGKARGMPHKNGGWVTCSKCKGLGGIDKHEIQNR